MRVVLDNRGAIFLRRMLAALLLILMSPNALGSSDSAVEALLARPAPPAGVVFEVVSGDADALATALPKIQQHIDALRQRFPNLSVAVVSHGYEQFSLLNEHSASRSNIHGLAKDLLSNTSVPVEVCGNHARMYGHGADAFPVYVEVVPAAPARIKDYQAVGYELIVMR